MWVAVVTFLVGSLVVAEVGRRAAAGTLPRSSLVGIRIAATMRDDESWDVGHRAAGPLLLATGIVATAIALVAGAVATTAEDPAAAVVLLVGAGVLVGGVLWAGRVAARAVRDRAGR